MTTSETTRKPLVCFVDDMPDIRGQECSYAGLPFSVGKVLGQIPPYAKLPARNPLTPNPRAIISAVHLFGREVQREEASPGEGL